MAIPLEAKTRTGQAEILRQEGRVPAVVYGPHIQSMSVSVPYVRFEKVYNDAGESTLIDLGVEGGETLPVLIKDIQYNPVSGKIQHIDFRHVTMDEEMEVSIELHFIGEAPAEKMGGTLIKTLESIDVRCMPADLVDEIDVDLSVLSDYDAQITVADVVLPPGLTVLDSPDTLIAKVAEPLSEEQLNAMEAQEEKSVENIEVVGKKKEDETAPESEGTEKTDKKADKKTE